MDEVWKQTVDNGTFTCEVIGDPVNGYLGMLSVTVTKTGEVLLDEEVGLSYGAQFGPDVGDVADWQDKCIKVIDEYLGQS